MGNIDTDEIPVIDLSGNNDDEVSARLVQALSTIGFATLINHGIEADLIQSAFKQSEVFFSLPLEEKMKRKFTSHASNRGYIPLESETHQSIKADKKETFDIGWDGDNDTPGNDWPSDEFRQVMLRYFECMDSLHLRMMRLLGIGLRLEDSDFFVKHGDEKHENLRLLHYPELPANSVTTPDSLIQRGAVHTDFGTITLLAQDDVGGLRAKRLDGSWVSVPPRANSIVVNVGDMLQQWSNDALRATPHQVVQEVSHVTLIPERYSIAFFCNPNKEVMVEPLKECCLSEKPRYSPVKAHDYLTLRLTQTIDTAAQN